MLPLPQKSRLINEQCTAEWVVQCHADKAKGLPLFTITVVNSQTTAPAPTLAPTAPAATAPVQATPQAPVAAVQVLGTTAWPIAAAVPINNSSVLDADNADGTVADANLSIDSEAVSKVPPPVPFAVPHLLWQCAVDSHDSAAVEPHSNITALVDDGAHLVLIHLEIVDRLHLK